MSQTQFSVVIPTFHRNEVLARCLERLAPGVQTLSAERYEVIVTDAGTRSTAEAMLRERFPWARWTHMPGAWPGRNRNQGARLARGEWVAFLDDDCLVQPDYLQALWETATGANPKVEVIEGKIVCPDELDHPLYVCPRNWHGGLYWSANLCVRHDCFERMHGFAEDLGRLEDMEFAHRIRAQKLHAIFASRAVAFHPRLELTLREYWHRTLLQRWTLAYRLKTGQSLPLDAPPGRVLVKLTQVETINLLRTTYHLVCRFQADRWRFLIFAELWKWLTFPVYLPYLMVWETRFRRQFRAHPMGPAG